MLIGYESLKENLTIVSVKEKKTKEKEWEQKNEILWIIYFLMIIQLFNRNVPLSDMYFSFLYPQGFDFTYCEVPKLSGHTWSIVLFFSTDYIESARTHFHITLDSCHWEKAISVYSHHDLQRIPQGERQSGKLLP